MGDVIERKIFDDLLVRLKGGGGVRLFALIGEVISEHADGETHDNQYEKLFPIHLAAVLLRFTKAREMPATVTRSGMPAILSHFKRFWSESTSRFRSLRTCFNSWFTSACFWRNWVSSACCSGDMIMRCWPLPCLACCSSFRRVCVSCKLASRSWIFCR